MAIIKQIKDSQGNVHDIVDSKTGATNSTEKLFLIGSKTQTAQAETFSNSEVYIRGGAFCANIVNANSVNVRDDITTDGTIFARDIWLGYDSTDVPHRISFGDYLDEETSYAYIEENPDDSLTFFANKQIKILANDEIYLNNVYATNNAVHADAFYQSSDERLKTFTEDYNVNLDDLKNIKTGKFYWNSDKNKVINGGVSAQTVEEYFPELVNEDKNGMKSVNYDGLAVVAIAAIKKLTERIEQLEDIIRNK